MYLKKYNLLNFKSYDEAELELHPKINCFVGNNGQGKTNLLDGIFYLSMCKSNFNSADYQNIQHNQEFFVIQGVYDRQGKDESIYCAVKKDSGKIFKKNGKEYQRLADHIGFIPIVIISPADASLILDGSDERRKYMNGVISQYNRTYLENTIKYNKLIANRNKILKEKGFSGSGSLREVIEVIDEQLQTLATPIYSQRLEFTQKLTPIFQEYYQQVSNGAEQVELVYKSHLADNNMLELLSESYEKDRILQYTTKGIHKDDLTLTLNGNPIKKEGSQGQQKTFLIALKLAQFSFIQQISGLKPILLLDDIFDKLDMIRVKQFIKLIANEKFGQIFITDTNAERVSSIMTSSNIEHYMYEVDNSKVKSVEL
ncbi:MAG: DNA replication/repair protein RecF [Bacteroidales bacterium]